MENEIINRHIVGKTSPAMIMSKNRKENYAVGRPLYPYRCDEVCVLAIKFPVALYRGNVDGLFGS